MGKKCVKKSLSIVILMMLIGVVFSSSSVALEKDLEETNHSNKGFEEYMNLLGDKEKKIMERALEVGLYTIYSSGLGVKILPVTQPIKEGIIRPCFTAFIVFIGGDTTIRKIGTGIIDDEWSLFLHGIFFVGVGFIFVDTNLFMRDDYVFIGVSLTRPLIIFGT